MPKRSATNKKFADSEVRELRARLDAAENTLHAIRTGSIDALIVSSERGERVLTLSGTDNAYRVFVEAMQEGAVTVTEDGTVLYCNQCFAAMLHSAPETMVGRPVLHLIAPEDHERFEGLFAEAMQAGAAKAELCLRTAGGEEIPALISLRSLEEFGPRALCMVVTDLREQKQNQKLLEAGKLARLIIEQAAEAIAVCDRHGRITHANRALIEICGCNALFQPFDSVLRLRFEGFHPDEQARYFSIDEVLAGIGLRGAEVSLARGKSRLAFLCSAAPIRDKGGESVGCVVTLFDISERKRAEESLRHSEQLAATGRLAATIAHEINNPLEGITNLLYLIETLPNLNPSAVDYARAAQQELARVAHITKQTLTFYRESPRPQPLQIRQIVEDIVGLYAGKLQQKQIRLRKELADVEISGFRNEIMQVVSNLLLNAVDATPAGSEICLRTRPSHEWTNSSRPGVRIVVADRGPGIAAEDRRNLFEPFFTTKGERGTGLGLWVSRGIVHRHEGFIRFRSSNEGARSGTVFSIFLPASPEARNSDLRQSELFS